MKDIIWTGDTGMKEASMTADYLSILISAGETEKIERKREIDLSTRRSKGEFVLDMLSLVNSHEQSAAYMLIGVEDDGMLFDLSHKNYDDATFQQLVNSLVEPPVDFSYTPVEMNGNRIGVITIQPSAQRFHVLSKDYPDDKGGKYLEKGDTRIKSGSRKVRPCALDYERLRESVLLQAVRHAELTVSFSDGSSIMDARPATQLVYYPPMAGGIIGTGNVMAGGMPGSTVQQNMSQQSSRQVRSPLQLHLNAANTGLAPAETIVIELTPPSQCQSGFHTGKAADGWAVTTVPGTMRSRFTRDTLLHNDEVTLAIMLLQLPQENEQYQIAWKAFAANISDVHEGMLIVNYGEIKTAHSAGG